MDNLATLALTAEQEYVIQARSTNSFESNKDSRLYSLCEASKTLTENSNTSSDTNYDIHINPINGHRNISTQNHCTNNIDFNFNGHYNQYKYHKEPLELGYNRVCLSNSEKSSDFDFENDIYSSSTETDFSVKNAPDCIEIKLLQNKYSRIRQKLSHSKKRNQCLTQKIISLKAKNKKMNQKNTSVSGLDSRSYADYPSIVKKVISPSPYSDKKYSRNASIKFPNQDYTRQWYGIANGLDVTVPLFKKDYDISYRYTQTFGYKDPLADKSNNVTKSDALGLCYKENRKSEINFNSNTPNMHKRSKTLPGFSMSNYNSIDYSQNHNIYDKYTHNPGLKTKDISSRDIFTINELSRNQNKHISDQNTIKKDTQLNKFRFPQSLECYSCEKKTSYLDSSLPKRAYNDCKYKENPYNLSPIKNNDIKNPLGLDLLKTSHYRSSEEKKILEPYKSSETYPNSINKQQQPNLNKIKALNKYTFRDAENSKLFLGANIKMGYFPGNISQRNIIAPKSKKNSYVIDSHNNRQYFEGKIRRRNIDMNSKIRSVQPVEKNINGDYVLPVQVGILTVLSLGKVIYNPSNFHNERYIWPVGYMVQREYYSMKEAGKQVIYICRVSEDSDDPKFIIESEDMPNKPIIANTATGAWTTVVKQVNKINKRNHSNSASGPDYFGFSHPTIAKMIQDLPNALKCRNYIAQKFISMKDRHVRGVMKKGRGGKPNPELIKRGQKALKTSANI
ncbi:hypothetical protein BB561_004094 [Smittium simulii]|uniref:FYR N-terminal domain-containing protein n=1 Tax=Smittium simulii TaxID=133385 RepID=A0A2T9YI25_9FUNG|nr:hypothetical protein BB561_004094 [Smittium simulii]